MKRTKFFIIVMLAILLAAMLPASNLFDQIVSAQQETCPDDGDWVKEDGLSGTSYTYNAPDGKFINETCYKAGTGVVYSTISPPASTVTVESSIWNKDTCPDDTGCNYQDLSHASFKLVDPPKTEDPGTASAIAGSCVWDEVSGSVTPVTITLDNASLTLNSVLYTASTTVTDLAPGNYSYSWTANLGYTGSGSGSIEIVDCSPKGEEEGTASAIAGSCVWDEVSGSVTPVTITLDNASLTLNGVLHTTPTIVTDLAPGNYPYSWTANSGYTGSGSGSIEIVDCSPKDGDIASASAKVQPCGPEDNTHPVNISTTGVTMTIIPPNSTTSLSILGRLATWVHPDPITGANPQTYTGLVVGTYMLSYELDDGYDDPGNLPTNFIIEECKEDEDKEEEEDKPDDIVDPSPDFAAGGSGPSLIAFLMPAFIGVSELSLGYFLIKERIKKTH